MKKVTPEIENIIIENYYTKSVYQLSDMCGVELNTSNINAVIKRNGMQLKSKMNGHNLEDIHSELVDLINRGYNNKDIIKMLKLTCSPSLVSIFRKTHNLQRSGSYHTINPELLAQAIELYHEQEKSPKEIGEILGVNHDAIFAAIKKISSSRNISSAVNISKVKYSGELSPNWKGGLCIKRSTANHVWSGSYRQTIRERDAFKCKICDKSSAQEYYDLNKNLSVHHIIPFRVYKDNPPHILVTLCQSCHISVEHKTRDELIERFYCIPDNELVEFFVTVFR